MFTSTGTVGILIGVAIAVLFIVRQFMPRRVNVVWLVVVPAVLAYFAFNSLSGIGASVWVVVGLNVTIGLVLGIARAATFRIWLNEHGQAFMQGTLATAALWLALIVVRIGLYGVEARFGLISETQSAAVLLPLAATFAGQNLLVWRRVQRRAAVAV